MDNIKEELKMEKEKLSSLEDELNIYYLKLGKQIQEIVELEGREINKLVDKIVLKKKNVKKLENMLK